MNIFFLKTYILIHVFVQIVSLSDMDLTILIEQIKNHPNQTLQDVYKSCYQDEYGPGHLIANESSAIKSLYSEINSIENDYDPITLFEQTGLKGNYLRVDLTLIRDGKIPFFVLFRALVFSAKIGGQKTDENWDKIWSEIVEAIKKSDLKFENFEKDLEELDKISKSDDKVVHHSEMYENTYHHIIELLKKMFLKNLLNLFVNNIY